MRPLSFVVAAVLGIAALHADAAAVPMGFDLNWDNCLYRASNRVADFALYYDVTDAPAVNHQVMRMYGSLRTGATVENVIGWQADLYQDVEGTTSVDWWRLGAGECRDGALTFAVHGFTNTTSCDQTLMETSPAPIATLNWSSDTPTPGHARIHLASVRTTRATMLGNVKYQLFAVSIDSRYSLYDPDDPAGARACSGVLDGACFVLTSVTLDSPTGAQIYFTTQEISSYTTVNGGAYTDCFDALPARRATWGRVKSLYR